jgi:hypothetical protein
MNVWMDSEEERERESDGGKKKTKRRCMFGHVHDQTMLSRLSVSFSLSLSLFLSCFLFVVASDYFCIDFMHSSAKKEAARDPIYLNGLFVIPKPGRLKNMLRMCCFTYADCKHFKEYFYQIRISWATIDQETKVQMSLFKDATCVTVCLVRSDHLAMLTTSSLLALRNTKQICLAFGD